MLSTIVLAISCLGLYLVGMVLWAFFLRMGLRWAKVPEVTTWGVILTTASVTVLQIATNVVQVVLSPLFDALSLNLVLILASAVIIPCLVIRSIFKVRYPLALRACLPTLIAASINIALVLFVSRPYLFEAFSMPSNAMAPTLVDKHWQGVCEKCGQPNYCAPMDEHFGPPGPQRMICDNFHVTEAAIVDNTVYSTDHFLVAKFLTPQRWDLVVFHFPADPNALYVMRLVGFPGEKIHIEAGAVWVNGQQLTPPDSMGDIEYVSEIPYARDLPSWGSHDRPATLGEDEYFVLGDFSERSIDSRFWDQGAPGHNPFAVPASHMKGVVTHTHWPPARWRIHR